MYAAQQAAEAKAQAMPDVSANQPAAGSRQREQGDIHVIAFWPHRFNADGFAGLVDLPRCNGPKPRRTRAKAVNG